MRRDGVGLRQNGKSCQSFDAFSVSQHETALLIFGSIPIQIALPVINAIE